MKSKLRWLLLLCVLLFQQTIFAQDESNIQFGKITASDFDVSAGKLDSGANAIIIADIGKTSFEGNRKSDMTMVFTRFMRVKILNKNGFSVADQRIGLWHDGIEREEKVSNLKGSTFNLENGKITETKLDPKTVFTEHYDKNLDIQKFTLPDLKEGSVYDIMYTVKSDFYENLRSWNFQGEYPKLWTEYETTIPPCFTYLIRLQGDDHFDIHTTKSVFQHFTITVNNGTQADDFYDFQGDSRQQRWVKKNVPALKEEPYTTTIDNYVSKLSFNLRYIQWMQTSERHDMLRDWFKLASLLMDDQDFGLKLKNDNSWLSDAVKTCTSGCTTDEEKIRKIYAYVRDNFSCTSREGVWVQSSLKDVYKKKGGEAAEINLLLTAMLRQAHITADPVVLSTRENGVANIAYPLIRDYNYVVCEAYDGNKQYTLDASVPFAGFGYLPLDCYNGEGRIINAEKPYIVELSPDSLLEAKRTQVFISNDPKGFPVGSFESVLGREESHTLRQEIKKTTEKDYFKKIQNNYGSDVSIENTGLDSLGSLDQPVAVHYDFDLKNMLTSNVVYFNPMMEELYKNNPFKSLERHYPVEMPYKMDELYVLSMEIPKGYVVDEIPKSAKVVLNETDGLFEFLVQKNSTNIQMRMHLKLNRANFQTEDYATLRDFFAYVVKKENEQIVFKKMP